MKGSYIDAQVIAAIEAQEGTDRFDRSKLLRLIDELNDNHGRANGYAVHALLRAILAHIPPLLGSADFATAVNNYRWSRTDRVYMRKHCPGSADSTGRSWFIRPVAVASCPSCADVR